MIKHFLYLDGGAEGARPDLPLVDVEHQEEEAGDAEQRQKAAPQRQSRGHPLQHAALSMTKTPTTISS